MSFQFSPAALSRSHLLRCSCFRLLWYSQCLLSPPIQSRQMDGLCVSVALLGDMMSCDTLSSAATESLAEILNPLSDQLDSRPPCCLLLSRRAVILHSQGSTPQTIAGCHGYTCEPMQFHKLSIRYLAVKFKSANKTLCS